MRTADCCTKIQFLYSRCSPQEFHHVTYLISLDVFPKVDKKVKLATSSTQWAITLQYFNLKYLNCVMIFPLGMAATYSSTAIYYETASKYN